MKDEIKSFLLGIIFTLFCIVEYVLFGYIHDECGSVIYSVFGCICIDLLCLYTLLILYTFFEVDWKNRWKNYLKELPVIILLSCILPFINPSIDNMIDVNGFIGSLCDICIFGFIIFFYMLLPLFNLRHWKW